MGVALTSFSALYFEAQNEKTREHHLKTKLRLDFSQEHCISSVLT